MVSRIAIMYYLLLLLLLLLLVVRSCLHTAAFVCCFSSTWIKMEMSSPQKLCATHYYYYLWIVFMQISIVTSSKMMKSFEILFHLLNTIVYIFFMKNFLTWAIHLPIDSSFDALLARNLIFHLANNSWYTNILSHTNNTRAAWCHYWLKTISQFDY